jgi:sporulation integral membrane protein YtvI
VSRIPDILVGVVTGFLATYYFIADHDRLKQMVKDHTSVAFHKRCQQMYEHILRAVGGYFQAQFKIMMVIYVILLAGLMLLRVKYAWLIGFGIAFLDMLPVFGTGTVLVPWAVIKLFSGNYKVALGMVLLYVITLVVHQLIQPKMVGDTVGMDTFTTIIFMYIGYKVSGVIGMILAIPLGMLLVYFYKDGGFDNIIWCFKELAGDFNRLRRIDRSK